MNRLSLKKRTQILKCLVEGNSIRATARICDVVKNTVIKLLVEVGGACMDYQDEHLRNLSCKRVQCDEIWAFCHCKEKNIPRDKKGLFGYGDVYTWTALCADSKLMISWMVGRRDAVWARRFVNDLAGRLTNRVQLTTDGHKVYLLAIDSEFGLDIDYAMLVKMYGESSEHNEKRYSPANFVSSTKQVICGKPEPQHISTSYVERSNLTMRMGMRRFTRLTNGFSKKVANLVCAVSLHFMYYNFVRIDQSLRVTPAMEAGVSDHVWNIEDIARLAE
ncbi:MAG: IS1 family transposase [Syntrophobacteraceae bacterium]